MDEISLPFTMQASVSYGDPPAADPLDDGPLPLGWVRIPVSFQVTLPAEVMEQAGNGGRAGAGQDSGAGVQIVQNSLRLGDRSHPGDARRWKDFDTLLGASSGDAAPTEAPPSGRQALAAVPRSKSGAAVPLPAAFGGAPPARDFDAFLDFMGDPERHPTAAPPVRASGAP